MNLYVSDYHFFNEDFVAWRGCTTVEEMNAQMAGPWNARVRDEDTVYILGDFSHGTGEQTNALLKSLKGKKVLLRGNHDRYLEDPAFDPSLFEDIADYKEIMDGDRLVVLSHYPMLFHNGQYRFLGQPGAETVMVYGHLHAMFDEQLLTDILRRSSVLTRRMQGVKEPVPVVCRMVNCYCRFCGDAPLSLDEWLPLDEARRSKMPPMDY